MPYLISTSFDQFDEAISIKSDAADVAAARRKAIVDSLHGKLDILDSFPTGSLLRGTGLKGVSDLDIVAVLHYGKHVQGRTPSQLLEAVREAAASYNARIVRKNGQAVTLYFRTWPNVDLVPASRTTTLDGLHRLSIPDANSEQWIRTDPGRHDREISAIGADGRRLIRMAKCWNRAHSEYLQSFHIECIVLAMSRVIWTDDEDEWPWAISKFFEKALELTAPGGVLSTACDDSDWSELRSRLKTGYETASDAWYDVHSRRDSASAIGSLRRLFGDAFPKYG